jgi:uncharacterized protein (UPF0548 family)
MVLDHLALSRRSAGFSVSKNRGQGPQVFERSRNQLMAWGVQRGAGLVVESDAARAETGAALTVRLGRGQFAVVAPCRVVYTIQEPDRVGFAYGTLVGHPERGEELFLVERQADDSVTLTIRAFSRPARWYTRLAGPLYRLVQRLIIERYLRALDGGLELAQIGDSCGS